MSRYDVAVIGGGVVGAATALGLAQAGFKTALLERGPGAQALDLSTYDPRVYALAPGSSAYLERLGVWSRVLAARASAYQHMQVWEHHAEQPLRFSAPEAGVAMLGHIVENEVLLAVLWAPAANLDRLPNTAVESVETSPRGASLMLADGRVLKASLVVAAEGADSPTRQQAGLEVEEYRYPQQALVCHVQTERPHQATAWQRFTPEGVLAFLPLADGRSSIVWSTTKAAELRALDEASFLAELEQASEGVLGRITSATPRLGFPLRLLLARDWVAERLVLVGDAAHVIHPLAGQGVNLGLADAEALVQTLGAARSAGQDLGSVRVLGRYARARRADTLDMLALTDGLYRAFGPASAGWAEWRYAGMQAVNRFVPLKRALIQRALQA